MKLRSPLLICLLVVSTTASQLRSLPSEKILDLLRSWNLENEFLSVFEDQGYDGFALEVMTKEDLDAEFPNSSPIHRRALYSRIQDLKNPHRVARNLKEDEKKDAKYEPKPASYFKDYHGVNMNHEKGWITYGKDKDIKIYRDGKGMLKFEAAAIDFVSAKVTYNGKPLGTAGSGGGSGGGGNFNACTDNKVAPKQGGGSDMRKAWQFGRPFVCDKTNTYGIFKTRENIQMASFRCPNMQMDYIHDENECKKAAQALGLKFSKLETHSHKQRPKGCWYHTTTLYFNKDKSGEDTTYNAKRYSICKKKGTPPVLLPGVYARAGGGKNNGKNCNDMCKGHGTNMKWASYQEQMAVCFAFATKPFNKLLVHDTGNDSYPLWEPNNGWCKINKDLRNSKSFKGSNGDTVLCKCAATCAKGKPCFIE